MKKFISAGTAQMIQKETDKGTIQLGKGEAKTATFLFSDIRGFTSMSEELPPETVVNIVNFYLNLQSQIIRKHGGDIDKFVGDQVMGVFSSNDMAQQAMQAGMEIQRTIFHQNERRTRNRQIITNVGIGIHMGRVVMGNIGAQDRMDFTAIGDAVNLAARLCGIAGPGNIVISEAIYQFVRGSIPVSETERIMVKGKKEPVQIYRIKS